MKRSTLRLLSSIFLVTLGALNPSALAGEKEKLGDLSWLAHEAKSYQQFTKAKRDASFAEAKKSYIERQKKSEIANKTNFDHLIKNTVSKQVGHDRPRIPKFPNAIHDNATLGEGTTIEDNRYVIISNTWIPEATEEDEHVGLSSAEEYSLFVDLDAKQSALVNCDKSSGSGVTTVYSQTIDVQKISGKILKFLKDTTDECGDCKIEYVGSSKTTADISLKVCGK